MKAGEFKTGGDPVPDKTVAVPEQLSEMEKIEKKVLQRVIKGFIPDFPDEKLKRITLAKLWTFIEGYDLPELLLDSLRDEMLERFVDISP